MEKEGWLCLCGCAPFVDLLFCAREKEDAAEEDVTATGFYYWNEQDPELQWRVYDTVVAWRAQGIASVKSGGKRVTVAIGTRGQYFEVEPESLIQGEGVIPGRPGPLRRLVAIDDVIIAVGMGRSVLERRDRGEWEEVGPGTSDADGDRIVGFEGIAGRSLDDLYTAGWGGEIWHRTGGAWQQIDSPTNANLNALACASDGKVYAVGDNGSLVVGSGDDWEVVDSGRTENLQDVVEYGGEVFVASDFEILRLSDDGLVSEDRFADGDKPITCLSLMTAADGIVSLGPQDIFRFSGDQWQRIL
jgi:hypothetical protein